MKEPGFILRTRQGRRAAARSNPLGWIAFTLAAAVSIACAGSIIFGVNRYAEMTRGLPSPELLPVLLDPVGGSLLEPTRVFDREGEELLWQFSNPAAPARSYAAITDGEILFYSEVPEDLILATLAVLDVEYLQRPEAFLPAVLESGEDPIPETLAADLLLWMEQDHPYREVRVKLLADQVTARFGREKILEWYLNSAFFGHQVYGVSQAAEFYFDKDLADLSLGESALLAAVARYPALNPLDAPGAARENQAEVLDKMAAAGFITENDADAAARRQLAYSDPRAGTGSNQPAYIDLVLQEASQTIPIERLLQGGFHLISTVDVQLQGELECTLDYLAERIQGEDPQLDERCQTARLLPKFEGPDLPGTAALEMNLALLDPGSGELLALAGKHTADQELTWREPRFPGTLVTPFIYINAFTQGFEPASLVWDIPLEGSNASAADFHPGCAADCQYLGPVNIRTALVNDLLSPAQQVLHSQSGGQLRTTLELFGFNLQPGNCPDCPVFQEGSALELIDLMQGYGVFASQGYLTGRLGGEPDLALSPASLLRIEDSSGIVYPLPQTREEKKVISEELAYLVNHVLSDPDAWLTPREREFFRIGRPVGVKLGYVPGSPSGWTIGYTPAHVVGAWAGFSDLESGSSSSAVEVTSILWRALSQYLSRAEAGQGWEMPPGVLMRDVCYPSGDMPTDYCPRVVREVFIEGYEPQVLDNLYQVYQVNRETGRLASVFTPAGQIIERVYLNIPPRARDWAADAGLEPPPELYDLSDPAAETTRLELASPENLSFVHGRVWITGTIPEENFLSARLQYGAGLNPQSWLQIGEEISGPVSEAYLGTWDTSGLEEGVYALQLVLIKENQEIEKRSLLVSVDNSPPEIILITDLSGGEIAYQPERDILLEVQFSNQSEIDRVDFYLDGSLLASRGLEPFLAPWRTTLGDHTLRVVARDQAGNQTELEVEFEVVRGEQGD